MSAFTEDRKHLYVEVLRETCNATKAAQAVGVSSTTVSKHRKDDALFDERCVEALNEGIDLLEHEAHRRAFQGTQRGVYHKGELIDVVHEYSDTLTTFLLKAHRPEKYRERSQVDSNVTGTHTLIVETGVPHCGADDLV